jgi:hypothetical protein
MTPQLFIILVICIAGFFILSGITIAFVFWMKGRHYIVEILSTGNFRIHRAYKLNLRRMGFKLKGEDYTLSDRSVGFINGCRACFIKNNAPAALVWPITDKGLEWGFISAGTLTAIINDEHVGVIARGGQKSISAKDILTLIGLIVIFFFVLLIFAKVFGIIKSKPDAAALAAAQAAAGK